MDDWIQKRIRHEAWKGREPEEEGRDLDDTFNEYPSIFSRLCNTLQGRLFLHWMEARVQLGEYLETMALRGLRYWRMCDMLAIIGTILSLDYMQDNPEQG
jgi:hypothetical protein